MTIDHAAERTDFDDSDLITCDHCLERRLPSEVDEAGICVVCYEESEGVMPDYYCKQGIGENRAESQLLREIRTMPTPPDWRFSIFAWDQARKMAAAIVERCESGELAVLRSRLEEAEQSAAAWNSLMTSLEAIGDLKGGAQEKGDAALNAYIKTWEGQKTRITALEATLAAIREKCEQAKNGSLRTTVRAIHQLAGGPDDAK